MQFVNILGSSRSRLKGNPGRTVCSLAERRASSKAELLAKGEAVVILFSEKSRNREIYRCHNIMNEQSPSCWLSVVWHESHMESQNDNDPACVSDSFLKTISKMCAA